MGLRSPSRNQSHLLPNEDGTCAVQSTETNRVNQFCCIHLCLQKITHILPKVRFKVRIGHFKRL